MSGAEAYKDKVVDQLHNNVINDGDIDQLIAMVNHSSSTLDESMILSILPTINEVLGDENYHQLDPTFKVVELYQILLTHLPSEVILSLYPIEVIIKNLSYQNQFSLLILKLLTIKYQEIDLFDHDILFTILSMYLTNDELIISICNQVEKLFTIIAQSPKLYEAKYQQLFQSAKNSDNSTIITRLLSLIVINPLIFNYSFDINPDSDDVLLNILIIQFYTDLIGKVDIKSLPINTMIKLFSLRDENLNIASFLITDVNNFFVKLSYLPTDDNYFDFLNTVTVANDGDIHLLSNINPSIIPQTVMDDLIDRPLFNAKYFTILLNLVKSKKWFELLTNQKLHPTLVKSLSNDHIYKLLVNLSSSSFGINWLLNSPTIMNDYVINLTPVYNEIYQLKLQVLGNLINIPDLTIWEDRVIEAYKLMKNGRNIRSEPQVDVMDQAA